MKHNYSSKTPYRRVVTSRKKLEYFITAPWNMDL